MHEYFKNRAFTIAVPYWNYKHTKWIGGAGARVIHLLLLIFISIKFTCVCNISVSHYTHKYIHEKYFWKKMQNFLQAKLFTHYFQCARVLFSYQSSAKYLWTKYISKKYAVSNIYNVMSHKKMHAHTHREIW